VILSDKQRERFIHCVYAGVKMPVDFEVGIYKVYTEFSPYPSTSLSYHYVGVGGTCTPRMRQPGYIGEFG
jgi:hypothetical protein